MMKKLFWLVLSTVILTGQSIFAQEADSEVQSSQREDSLLQVVNELSDRVQKTEDAARNERIWKKRAKYFNIGYINPEKPDVPLNKNDAFQKVQKRHVQEKR